eukprot:Gb_20122 [translate_table: standard]
MLGTVSLAVALQFGSSSIWNKFIFLATGRPGDCMEMLLECLRNLGCRLGIVTGKRICRGGMHGRCICRAVEEEWRPLGSGGRHWSVSEEGRGEVDPNGYGRCIPYLCVEVCWCIEQPWEAVAMEDRHREETRSIWKNTNRRAKYEQSRDGDGGLNSDAHFFKIILIFKCMN